MKTFELAIPGHIIACKTWGSPQNPPILAIHGWQDNINSFEPIAKYLQQHVHLIAIDLPGHGLSSHLPIGSHYHFIDGVFAIVQIIQALQRDKVHLLGHSLGACLASIVAGIAPQYVLSLGLIEALGPISSPEETAAQQLSQFLKSLSASHSKEPKGYNSMEQAIHVRAARGYVSLEIAQILGTRGIKEKKGSYYWQHDRRLAQVSPLRMTEGQIRSCLQQIEAKTLLLWASEGFSFNTELMQQRINAVPDLTVERLDGGHHIHMEQPEAVAKLLAEFYLA